MAERVKRRLFLFLDGTWNEDQTSPTNIVRMRECLKLGVDDALARGDPTRKVSGSIVRTSDGAEYEYLVYYDRGVGTGLWFDRWTGGMFGTGLDLNIRQAYRFLSEHYAEGDEIFVFGFSRGAFTARSVVGYLTAAGLMKPEFCTAENEERAWKHYRTGPADRYCGEWKALQAFMYDHERLTVTCLGVYDTVGALGVPLDWFRRFNAQKYAFHNTDLNALVEISLHAVAIDERRRSFAAALWQKPKFKRFPETTKIEQVWFPGAHSDIGGGYGNWLDEGGGSGRRQDIAFAWMIGRLRKHVPNLPLPSFGPFGHAALRVDWEAATKGTIHRPWAKLDPIRDAAVRMINQIPPLPRKGERVVGGIAHEEPIYEGIHVSALELLSVRGALVEGLEGIVPYRPRNLLAVLPAIAATYRHADAATWTVWKPYARTRPDGVLSEPELCVVGWDGNAISPFDASGVAAGGDILAMLPDPAALGLPFARRWAGAPGG